MECRGALRQECTKRGEFEIPMGKGINEIFHFTS